MKNAIPTNWKGYRFRSRLEARWAVFFTHMKMAFNYEPEGFRFPDGTCYLPDFILPEIRMWAEVKPFDPTPEELNKAHNLVEQFGMHLLFLVGPPDFRNYSAVCHDAGLPTEVVYTLDIYDHQRRLYDCERRLFAFPDYQPSEILSSPEYQKAVWISRSEPFDREAA